MRVKVLFAAVAAAALLPALAVAQPYDPGCVQSNRQNNTTGTVLGAIGGAIVGGAIAGHHNRGAGVVVGGVGGALAGNAIARSNDHPCPPGYYYPPPPPPPAPAYYGQGEPRGIHARIDYMQDRLNDAADNGRISRREAYRDNRELSFIRSEEARLRDQDGGYLRPEDRQYLEQRLDSLGQRLRWAENYG